MTVKGRALFPLKNAYVFRKIFGDAAHIAPLRSLVLSTRCLSRAELGALTLIDPHLLPDDPEGHRGVLDIFARTKGGAYVHIEIQIYSFKEFKKRLAELSADENERLVLESRERYARDWRARMKDAREDGVAEGLEKGIKKGRREGRQEGRQEGGLIMLFGLVRDGILGVTVAAKRSGLPLKAFKAKMAEYEASLQA